MSTIEMFISLAGAEPESEEAGVSVLLQAQPDDGGLIVALDGPGLVLQLSLAAGGTG